MSCSFLSGLSQSEMLVQEDVEGNKCIIEKQNKTQNKTNKQTKNKTKTKKTNAIKWEGGMGAPTPLNFALFMSECMNHYEMHLYLHQE